MKFNQLIIGSFLAITVFASCKKVIDVKETDFIGGEIALLTVQNNQQGIIGAYAAMDVEMGILLNSTLADEVKVAEFYNAGTTHEWQYGSTDIGLRDNFTAFPLYYRIIDRVNRVLVALPKATSTGAADEALRIRLRGEALFLRAYCHFELYRYYCNSALGTDLALAYMSTPSLEPQERIAVAPYFVRLKADLAQAKTLLPTANTEIYRASRLAATGLQTRIGLYLKEWADARTFAAEFIAGLPLATPAQFAQIWTDASSAEVAFKLSRTAAIGRRLGSLWRGTSANSANIGTVTWRPSDKLWNAYNQTNDIRFAAYFRNELSLAPRGTRLIGKYAGGPYATPTENVADAKVYRTGEMYLISAEAKAELGDLAGAAIDLNTLRGARISGYTNETFASKDELISAIYMERFKELPYEGHRFWDLKRRNLPVERIAADAPPGGTVTLSGGNFRFLLPIPNSEILANPKMVQNPGYAN